MMRLYHRTTCESAEAILATCFQDATGTYMTDRDWAGVWLADRPLGPNEGVYGTVLLRVYLALPEDELAHYEWVEAGTHYREFLIPAARINAHAIVHKVDDEDEEGV